MNGRAVKNDLNKFLTYLERGFGELEYFWFLEFQTRGAPHFHIGLTLPPPNRFERSYVAELWAGIAEAENWPYTAISSPYGEKNASKGLSTRNAVEAQHRRVKTWQKIIKEKGAARYAAKYVSKSYQKIVPEMYSNVGRFWGTSRRVKLGVGEQFTADENQVREVLKVLGREFDNWKVLPKIIFHSGILPKFKD